MLELHSNVKSISTIRGQWSKVDMQCSNNKCRNEKLTEHFIQGLVTALIESFVLLLSAFLCYDV